MFSAQATVSYLLVCFCQLVLELSRAITSKQTSHYSVFCFFAAIKYATKLPIRNLERNRVIVAVASVCVLCTRADDVKMLPPSV